MRVGDLVEFSDVPRESQGRICGIVIGIDIYEPRQPTIDNLTMMGDNRDESIVEVLWNNGLGWILERRVRLVNETW